MLLNRVVIPKWNEKKNQHYDEDVIIHCCMLCFQLDSSVFYSEFEHTVAAGLLPWWLVLWCFTENVVQFSCAFCLSHILIISSALWLACESQRYDDRSDVGTRYGCDYIINCLWRCFGCASTAVERKSVLNYLWRRFNDLLSHLNVVYKNYFESCLVCRVQYFSAHRENIFWQISIPTKINHHCKILIDFFFITDQFEQFIANWK